MSTSWLTGPVRVVDTERATPAVRQTVTIINSATMRLATITMLRISDSVLENALLGRQSSTRTGGVRGGTSSFRWWYCILPSDKNNKRERVK